MLLIDRVSKRFGDRMVLEEVTFSIDRREKVALVGPNGCGKSTLMKIVAGLERADSGSVGGDFAGGGARYLPQGALELEPADAAGCLPWFGGLWRWGRRLEAGESGSADESLRALDEFERAGGWRAFADLEETLRGLGVGHLSPDEPYSHLSGGERTKLGLTDLLNRPGSLLLLDEPSNHLDLAALAWLERFLVGFKGAVLITSHDRTLIDAVAEAVIELDPETHRARRFAGGYSEYQEEREREHQSRLDAYRRQQEQVQRVEEDIRRVKQHAARFDTTSANDHWRRIGKKVARSAKVRERKLERLLESSERVEKPGLVWTMKSDIPEAERAGEIVIEAHGLRLAFGDRTLFDGLNLLVRHGERVVLTGANGSGKTTLLRLLLGEIRPDAGTVRLGGGIVPGYLSQQQESLNLDRTPLEEIRSAAPLDETAARTYLHRFLFSGEEVFLRSRVLSYGQRSRLALARLILRGVNLLVLDEPMNHLDIPSRERFEEALAGFGGTVLAVSHDRYFIHRFGSRVLRLEDRRLAELNVESVGA